MDGLIGDGHEPFLTSLAKHSYELLLEEYVRKLEIDKLADPKATREQHLDDGSVALAFGLAHIHALLKPVYFLKGQILRQVLGQTRRLQQF